MQELKMSFLYGYLWDFSQVLIGANQGKQDLHMQVLKPSREARILDFACSAGNASAIFKSYDYTALDIDRVVIDFARFKFRNYPNMRFLCQDVLTLDKGEGYDCVVCGAAGHHIPNSQFVPILVKFKQLLRPGGHIGLFDPVKTGKESRLLRAVMSIDLGKYHKTVDEYHGLLAQAGLEILEEGIAEVKGPVLTYTNYAWFKLKPS